MGCDFFFDGNLPDETLQTKVINFVKDYFNKIDLVITPDPASAYSTEIHLRSVGTEYRSRTEHHETYSFNYFGIIPYCEDEYGITDHGQFIFNRNENGRLVKLMRLPDSYGIRPHPYYQDIPQSSDAMHETTSCVNTGQVIGKIDSTCEEQHQTSLPCTTVPYQYQVVVDDGGYARMGGGLAFALLLTICKLRWWPDLKMGDDYEKCEIVDALLEKYGLHQRMLDENLDFHTCYNLFITEYNKDFPPPSSEDSKEDILTAQAKWYLDFTARIEPYMKKRNHTLDADSPADSVDKSGGDS